MCAHRHNMQSIRSERRRRAYERVLYHQSCECSCRYRMSLWRMTLTAERFRPRQTHLICHRVTVVRPLRDLCFASSPYLCCLLPLLPSASPPPTLPLIPGWPSPGRACPFLPFSSPIPLPTRQPLNGLYP